MRSLSLLNRKPIIALLVGLLLSMVFQSSAVGEDDRSATIQRLYEFSQDMSEKLLPVRGGSKDKPLGCYLGSKDDIQYRSGYKDVEPRTQCEWAYDLNQFIVTSGGGWDKFQKYSKETPVASDANSILNDSLRSYGGGKDPKDAWERAHIPYDKQAAFADKWWKNNSRAYSSAVVPPKDWWLHDAVLDGNNLWTRYEQINGKGSADYVMWRDSELAKLLKKQ
jgi:hypothetical protein